MGIFRWIMSLLRRKKIAKHEYAPEKAIALKKDETICGQNLRLSQQVPCKNDKSEISEQACIYPDSQIVLRETQQQKRRRRRQQIQSDTPPVNEQLFAAQNTQDSSDFYPEDEKTTSAANAEAKENQCAAADAEKISEIETGCSIKDMVAIDVCRSEKTEEHEPGQAADKTSAIDESPEADMMLIAQKEDSVSEETENTLAEEAAEAEKNDVQEHQAKIISVETKIDEPRMQKCFAFVAEIFDELIKNNGFIALDPEDANRYEVVEKKSSFSLSKEPTTINRTIRRPSNRSSEIGIQEQESVDPKTGELKKQMVFTLQAQAYLLAHLDDIAACQQWSD